MTKSRPTFTRPCRLLGAPFAAVLLAASADTASAQPPRIGFTPHNGSVNEGATAAADSEHPLLEGDRQDRGACPRAPPATAPDGQPTARQQAIDALGEITIETEGIGLREAATISPAYDTPAALDEDAVFAASDTFQLTVTPVQDDDSRNDEFTLRLRSTRDDSIPAPRYSGHGHRRRPAGDGHLQPHRHRGSWNRARLDAAERPALPPRRTADFPALGESVGTSS